MRDPRVTALARVLVGYSTEIKRGDACLIEGEVAAQPLLQAVYEEVLYVQRDARRTFRAG